MVRVRVNIILGGITIGSIRVVMLMLERIFLMLQLEKLVKKLVLKLKQ